VYWYNSAVMAMHSKYVEAMLSAPMRESKSYELHFPDITPQTWERMMMFLENPSAARKMSTTDAFDVAELYDMFDFPMGRKLCDDVLHDFFGDLIQAEQNQSTPPHYAQRFVHALVVSDAYNLPTAREIGMEHLAQKISSTNTLYGRTMFQVEDMEKLVPVLTKEAEKEPKPSYLEDYTPDEIRAPSFPELFVLRAQNFEMKRSIQSAISSIFVSLKTADGRTVGAIYRKIENQMENGFNVFRNEYAPSCWIKVKIGAWIMVRQVQHQTAPT